MHIEITGGKVELLDRLNVKQRKALRAISADVLQVLKSKYDGDIEKIKDAKASEIRTDGELMNANDDFSRTAILVMVKSWDLAIPLPTTSDEWDEFEDADLYDELTRVITPLAFQQIGTSVAVSPETIADPDSPTVPSSDSNGGGPEATVL